MFKRIRGFSLIEVMVAIGVSGTVLLVVTTLSMFAYYQFHNMKSRLEAETSANRLEYLFKSYLSQALNISGVVTLTEASGMVATIADAATGQGQWLGDPNTTNTYNRMSDIAGDWLTLGVFVREAGTGPNGLPLPAAIWYRKPSPATSGVIFFENIDGTAMPAAVNMTPDYGDQFVSGVTNLEFQRQDLGEAGALQLSSLRISFTLRYGIRHSQAAGQNWCPQADIAAAVAGCVTPGLNYREVTRNFEIVLRNNFRTANSITGGARETRTLGPLYFFRVINPARWSL